MNLTIGWDIITKAKSYNGKLFVGEAYIKTLK